MHRVAGHMNMAIGWERSQRSGRRFALITAVVALVAAMLVVPTAPQADAAPPDAVVIDGFEDGDASDWGFFGGNLAGGGGGAATDRPYDGVGYLSTGWGGEGSASVFYGGGFRNFDNAAQVSPPADPWFNVWVLNQSNATADAYTLEITIREDLDGDGWTDGSEDSFRLDTSFTSAQFDDAWMQISAPLSSFADQFTGGNGTFDGALDEIVIVIASVSGDSGATIEADFDLFAFSSGAPIGGGGPIGDDVVFDDMEHGDPGANGWFSFNGNGGGGIGANALDLPPSNGGTFSIETGWGSGGNPGFFGGFGRTNAVDLFGTDHFNFWINPDPDQDYTLEINLQEDDNANGTADAGDDDEFQFNCVVAAAGPCAIAGGGWQLVSIPLADFFDDNSFFTGGNGVLDATGAAAGGNGELINVVLAVISNSGADVVFRTDYWVFTDGPLDGGDPGEAGQLITDFESGIAPAVPCAPNVFPLGFCTFNGAGSTIALADPTSPPAPAPPGADGTNNVLQMDVDVTSFAGFIHGFEAAGSPAPQDWSTREGISLVMFGTGSGTDLFLDILDNRNPDSTTDDAERYTVTFVDDFVGWQQLEFPFSSFTRKEIGNGAPSDGLGLFEMHGWALGALGTNGPRTYYVDDVQLYGVAAPPALAVNLATQNTFIDEGSTGSVAVKLNRPMGPSDPAEVSIDFQTEPSTATPDDEYTPTSGTLVFVNGGATEQSFTIATSDDTKFEGNERVVVRLTNPIDVERGPLFQGSALIVDNDVFNPALLDDFEQGAFLWQSDGRVELETAPVADRPGQDSTEHALVASVAASAPGYDAEIAAVRDSLAALLPSSDNRVTRRIEKAIRDLDKSLRASYWLDGFLLDAKRGHKSLNRFGNAFDDLERAIMDDPPETAAVNTAIGQLLDIASTIATNAIDFAVRNGADQARIDDALSQMELAAVDLANGKRTKAVRHFRRAWDRATQAALRLDSDEVALLSASFGHDFPLSQDWSSAESLQFWFHGDGSGDEIGVTLKNNRAADPGPSGWELVWSDEFDGPAGAPPDPAKWTHEIGDVTPDGKNGWGNEELQYYTDDPDNAATDGAGNLVITLSEADGTTECYYGECEYTSARLLTTDKAEFAYGRIESRLLVPQGQGIWPAFWSLGTDIDRNPWPGAGEIDFMEFVGRLPNEIFGTIHGPGYSGGGSFGNIYDFGEPVFNNFHTFTVEWEPNLITWYVDGIQYHQATPADVAPNAWVFDKPFFLLLNLAIGGNFGGPVGDDATFPQSYAIDYVRVYQGPDTAEQFETSFTDDAAGWQLITVPLDSFARSSVQPDGAPDDGLDLREVWGYGFETPGGSGGKQVMIDDVRLGFAPLPTDLTVTTTADDGPGSLRASLSQIATGGVIEFDPELAGLTIDLTSGPIVLDRSVTIDASMAPGVTLSGGGVTRVVEVAATATVVMNDLVIADGLGAPQGGGILNNGALSLDRVVVRDNVEGSAGPANFEFGGGGIYNAGGATLNLTDSTVSDNTSVNHPGGGIYGFFGSSINIVRSTVSGNLSGDVAGGLRSLGDATVVNSTFSANTSTVWHGGGIFHTDGQLTVTNSTFADNIAPAGTASGILVATFGAPANATLTNNVLEGEAGAFACAIEGGAGATITSGGSNVIGDGSCNPDGVTDQSSTDALLGPLADNGGPTLTHALGIGSPAIDAADLASCPVDDQRGVVRPQGAGCDVGAVEQS